MLVSNTKMFQGLAAIACLMSFEAAAQTTLPRVTATATRLDGGTITCYGTICADTLRSVEQMVFMQREFAQLTEEETKVDKDKFCEYLAKGRPPGCDLGNPPSAPGYDPGFIGNGCGDGSFASWIANEVVSNGVWGYEGNLDHPLPGVSFYAACQGHDFCYAIGEAKLTCDGRFESSLRGVCSAASSTYQQSCLMLSGIYNQAVDKFGLGAYNGAQADLSCAAWAYDMEANECDE